MDADVRALVAVLRTVLPQWGIGCLDPVGPL
jgi:hypothetical protein